MDFGLLGPLRVRADNGRPVDLAQPMQRATLAVLLLHAGQACPREHLIEALWGEGAPRTAADALRTYIYQLRRALRDATVTPGQSGGGDSAGISLAGQDAAARLQTTAAGYKMIVLPGELDLHVFGSLAKRGRDALDYGDYAEAERLLVMALQLWRQPPLADLPSSPAADAEAARLTEQRRDVAEALIDARLALGQHKDLIGELRAVVTDDPGREHARAQLMIALYRAGAKSEALAEYSRMCAVMRTEHGADPSPELKRLLAQILDDDPALAGPAGPASVPPRGAAPAAPPAAVASQLPADLRDFTGRADEAGALRRDLASPSRSAIVVSGPPGAGKTSLAIHVAHLSRGLYPDGQLYAELGGSAGPRPPEEVLAGFLRALGVPPGSMPAGLAERAAMYRSLLSGRRILVVADDVGSAAQARPLLPGAESSAIIITSRSRLAGLDGIQVLALAQLHEDEAAALLSRITGSAAAAGPGPARQVIAAAAGLPLAVRIAGARLAGGTSPPALAAYLADDPMTALTAGDLSVREAFAGALAPLGAAAARAFGLTALIPSHPFPRWAITALTGESDRHTATGLADTGLLQPEPDSGEGEPRYRMHPLVRAFAAEILAGLDPVTTRQAGDRLTATWLHLAGLAARASPPVPGPPLPEPAVAPSALSPAAAERITGPGPAWLRQERTGLLAVAWQACGDGAYQAAAALASRSLAGQLDAQEQDEAARLWGAIAAAAVSAGDQQATAAAWYWQAAALAVSTGTGPEVLQLLDRCLAYYQSAGDLRAVARVRGLQDGCAAAARPPQAAGHAG